MKIRNITVGLILIALASCSGERYVEVIDVEPVIDASALDRSKGDPFDFEAILESFQVNGGIYTMTYHGDFDQMTEMHHGQIMMMLEARDRAEKDSLHCSMYSYYDGEGGALFGRNFDNVMDRSRELTVGYFFPDDGYASIAFVPMMEFGFTPEKKFDPEDQQHVRLLLNGPVISIEGMNEKGVAVALASIERRKVEQLDCRDSRYFILIIREILDHAGSVDEAIAIVSKYNVFDNGRDIMTHHIFMAGPDGRSAVLEWKDGIMHVITSEGSSQVVTNYGLVGTAEIECRKNCKRYCSIDDDIRKNSGPMTWQYGMDMLREASQKNVTYNLDGQKKKVSTHWSAVFDLENLEVYICTELDYSRVYRFTLKNRAEYMERN